MNKLEIENKLKDNKLPDGWVKIKLSKVCNLSYGKNLATNNFKEDGK